MCLSIPPKFAVSSVIGYINGKSAVSIARNFIALKRNFTGESFWARGFYVSTMGLDEDGVRKYIRDQETEDTRLEHLNLFHNETPP
jgi:putative transposase